MKASYHSHSFFSSSLTLPIDSALITWLLEAIQAISLSLPGNQYILISSLSKFTKLQLRISFPPIITDSKDFYVTFIREEKRREEKKRGEERRGEERRAEERRDITSRLPSKHIHLSLVHVTNYGESWEVKGEWWYSEAQWQQGSVAGRAPRVQGSSPTQIHFSSHLHYYGLPGTDGRRCSEIQASEKWQVKDGEDWFWWDICKW